MIIWSKEKFCKDWSEKHEYGEIKAGKHMAFPCTDKGSSVDAQKTARDESRE